MQLILYFYGIFNAVQVCTNKVYIIINDVVTKESQTCIKRSWPLEQRKGGLLRQVAS
jgi:hypothetical protein